MRKSLLVLSFGIVVALSAVVVMAEAPENITLGGCADKKAAVEFPHAAHYELTECSTCHHTQEGLTADSEEAVEACISCHLEPEVEGTPRCGEMSVKKNPYHIKCIGCHKEQDAGPATCDECHPKAEG